MQDFRAPHITTCRKTNLLFSGSVSCEDRENKILPHYIRRNFSGANAPRQMARGWFHLAAKSRSATELSDKTFLRRKDRLIINLSLGGKKIEWKMMSIYRGFGLSCRGLIRIRLRKVDGFEMVFFLSFVFGFGILQVTMHKTIFRRWLIFVRF